MKHQRPPGVDGCGGIPAGCPQCIAIYRRLVGDAVPLCMACGGSHWADEECRAEAPADA